jgi:L-alanine-DL-glutamate epimerase-like enolase superfamily enzyme
LLVELVDTDGTSGCGEAPQVWQVSGESVAGAEACVRGPLRTVLMAGDLDNVLPLSRAVSTAVAGNFGAKAAVDVALHDLAARRLGIPLAGLLGGAQRHVATDVTVSAGEPAELADAARSRLTAGFGALKLKVGTDAAGDTARVRAVREAAGPGPRLRLDANQGWTPREAVSVISALADADLDVELVEQPVPARDLDGMAWVRARSELPILADESVYGVADLVEVIRRGAADMVNVKLAKCGGLRVARTLLELARECGLGALVGSMMESHVGVGAAASLAAAHGGSAVHDLDAAWWLARSPVRGGPTYEQGCVVLPEQPGLGIDGLAAR